MLHSGGPGFMKNLEKLKKCEFVMIYADVCRFESFIIGVGSILGRFAVYFILNLMDFAILRNRCS